MFTRLFFLMLFAGPLFVGAALAEIKIGVAVPLTGQYSWNGVGALNGVEQAISDINEAGGILGESIALEVVDDFCEPGQALVAAEKLIAEKVPMVIGHICSGAAIPASERYEKNGIILISPAATNPLLTERGFRYIFRTAGRDDMQGGMVADYLAEHQSEARIALIHDGRVYGQGIVDETKRKLENHGVEPTLIDSVAAGETEFSDLIERLETAGIDIVFYGGYQAEGGLLIRQAKNRMPKLQFVVPDGVASADFALIVGDAVNGILMTNFTDPTTLPSSAAALASFKSAGQEIDSGNLEFYAYAAVEVWAKAVELVGDTDAGKVVEAFRSNRFETALGQIGFDAKGDVVGTDPFSWHIWTTDGYTAVDPASIQR